MSTSDFESENGKMCETDHDPGEVRVTFSLQADDLNPDEISSHMGLEASHAFAKGDEYCGHLDKNTMGVRRRSSGVWQVRSHDSVTSTDPQDHAAWLLDRLEPKAGAIQEIMNRKGMYVGIWVWVEMEGYTGGWTLKADTIARLAKLCHEINFVYAGRVNDNTK